MKHPPLFPTYQGIEILESRIAPASVTFGFTDQDGDAVKVTSSKGTADQLKAAFTLSGGPLVGAVTLLDLTAKVNNLSVFAGADISIVATPAGGGDGLVRVVQVTATGVDLGKLTIDGELDSINAGDGNSATPGLKSITVEKWGNGDAFDSEVIGAITTLTVNGDFNGAYLKVRGSDSDDPDPAPPAPPAPHLTDPQGKIGTLFIGGSLLGTARENGGHIFVTGDITKATVSGSVKGFKAAVAPATAPTDQDFNARIYSGGTITSLVIGTDAVAGNLVGGDGASSGQIVGVNGIGSVLVKGSVQGGLGVESGRIFSRGAITSAVIGTDAAEGNLVGGDGDRSGQIVGVDGIGSVTVKGSVQGGVGVESGSIGAVSTIGKVVIAKDLLGGDVGARSGTILGYTTISSVTIGRDIKGGAGENSGAIGAGNDFTIPGTVLIGAVTVAGDIRGGDGASSGQIISQGKITSVTVGGSLIGGSQFESGAIGSLNGLGAIVITGDIIAGSGTRSGIIATEVEPEDLEERVATDPADANAPIASVFVGGSIQGIPDDDESSAGYRAGGILSSGRLGPVVVMGDVSGGDNSQTGRIASSHAIASVKIGGRLIGGSRDDSGSIFAGTSLGPVSIGDPTYDGIAVGSGLAEIGIGGFAGRGIIGAQGDRSGSVIAGTLTKIDVYGDVQGSLGGESGAIETTGPGAAGKMGAVYIRGSLEGGGGDGAGTNSGYVSSRADLTSVFVGGEVRGGGGDGSGVIVSTGNLGPVTIGGGGLGLSDLIGGGGNTSGAVISGGKLATIHVFGYLLGGDGPSSGRIETQGEGMSGNLGTVFIDRSLIGGTGPETAEDSGQIFSSGRIASVTIGDPKLVETEGGSGSVTGGNSPGSGSIISLLDMGAVKIKRNLQGGSGDRSGQILSLGKIASLTVGSKSVSGSIIGGTGAYLPADETESGDQFGQVFAEGAIGAVIVFGDVLGNPLETESLGGAYAAQVRGLSIASVTIHGNLQGGAGAHSGGFFATSSNIGPVAIGGNLEGGDGGQSGFLSAESNITSVAIDGKLLGGAGSGSGYVAAGVNLGAFGAGEINDGESVFRARISAGEKIASVTIHDSIFYADILAGYNTSGFAFQSGSQIGVVTIGTGDGTGIMEGTNIIAARSGSIGGFAGAGERAALADSGSALSRIAGVVVKGRVSNTPDPEDRFSILADYLVSVKVAKQLLPLHPNPQNDDLTNIPGTDTLSDTYYGERVGD